MVLADTETHGDLDRIANALTSAKEFKEAGDETTIVFDGAGTKWVPELSNPEHRLHKAFESVKDVVAGACSYCAKSFCVWCLIAAGCTFATVPLALPEARAALRHVSRGSA